METHLDNLLGLIDFKCKMAINKIEKDTFYSFRKRKCLACGSFFVPYHKVDYEYCQKCKPELSNFNNFNIISVVDEHTIYSIKT